MRPGWRGLLGLRKLVPKADRFGFGERGTQRGPHLGFLEGDVFPACLDELAEQRLELRVVRIQLVQLGEDFIGFLLLADGLAGELVAVGDPLRTTGQKYISSTTSCWTPR
jgi:hypothetical protein